MVENNELAKLGLPTGRPTMGSPIALRVLARMQGLQWITSAGFCQYLIETHIRGLADDLDFARGRRTKCR